MAKQPPKEDALCRLPPSSPSSEMGIAGCCLLDPQRAINECVEKGVSGGEVFYDMRVRELVETMVAMHEQLQPVDTITLSQWLKDNGTFEQVGGHAFIDECQDCVPSAANLPAYIETVKDKHTLRRYIATCTDVVGRIYDYEGDVDFLADEIERDMLAIRPNQGGDIKSAKELVAGSINQIEKLWENRGSISGISTGLSDLDKITDGMHGGDMIVISGFEKAGKTSLAMGVAEHAVLELKIPVAVFSLEMTSESLMMRMLCSRARVNLRNIREGFMRDSDFPSLTAAAGKLSVAPIYIDDSGDLTVMQLRAKARRLVQQHGVKLIVADYLQLLSSPETLKKGNREQEVSAVSKGIKAMAKELRVPVLVLSQQNEEGKTRESRAIVQDCDAVWKLKAVKEGEEQDGDAVPMIIRVDRQRNGATGNVPATFLRSFCRFELAAKHISDADVPSEQ